MKATSILTAVAILSAASLSLAQQSDKVPSLAPPRAPTADQLAKDAAQAPASNLGKSPNLGQKLEQLGSQTADEKTAGEIRDTLAQVVNDALSEDKFAALTAHLSAADRQHIGDIRREKFIELNKTISQVRSAFEEKYHQEFHFKPEFLKDAEVNLGPAKDVISVSLSNLEKNPAVNISPADTPSSPLMTTDKNGNDIPAQTGLSVVGGPTVVLVNESKMSPHAWKLDIPNEITGPQLRDTLKNHLQRVADQKTTWSEDPAATYRAVATQVFQALQDSSLATEQ